MRARVVDHWGQVQKAGDICYLHDDTGMLLSCPGCGQIVTLHFATYDPTGWHWNGDYDTPTLDKVIVHASDHHFMGCGWRGHLIGGEFVGAVEVI